MAIREKNRPAIVLVLTLTIVLGGCSDRRLGTKPWAGSCDEGASGSVYPIRQTDPAWSNTGLIAYHDYGIVCVRAGGGGLVDTSRAGLWIANTADGTRRRLLSDGYGPSWSPDGTALAFEQNFQIYRINVDATGLEQLTSSGQNFYPAWSTDGSTIIYDSNVVGPSQPFGLWMMNADGTNKRPFCSTRTYDDRTADWFPGGVKVAHALVSVDNPSIEIYATDTTSCTDMQLTDNGASNTHPRVSPDGTMIVFQSQSIDQYPPELWMMQADGKDPRQLTHGGGTHPSWSPDSRSIVFLRENQLRSCPEVNNIWILHLASGSVTPLIASTVPICP